VQFVANNQTKFLFLPKIKIIMSEERKNMLPFYIRVLIGLSYIAIGVIMLTTKAGFYMTNSKIFGWVFGIGCLAYGVFRMYRAQQVLKD
jgi:uncharacterized membrane protein YebE (DUF533 family)